MLKISVIIPVYNTQKYLKRCIDSVINQTYKDIEIIIVNDGSTDDSHKILQEYYITDFRIKYLKKENGGLSDARNFGIQHATGDYICFLDSDDYLAENLFERLEKNFIRFPDMIKYKMIKVDENDKELDSVDGPVFDWQTGEDAFNILFGKDIMIDPAWLYLYKRSFWIENNFEYPVGRYHEDFARTSLIMLKAKSVCSTNVYGYYYVQSSTSITRGNDEEKRFNRAMDLFEHYDYMIKKIKSYKLQNITMENIKIYYTNSIILELQNLSNENKKRYLEEIKKRKMFDNIKARNFKQFIKKVLLKINVDLYFKFK
mgnify:FL=1